MRNQIYYKIELKNKNIKKGVEANLSIMHSYFIYFYAVLMKKDILPFFFHVVLCSLGILVSDIYFALECFTILFVSKTMHSVLEALKMRYKKFLGILMLLLIILNFYSFAGY